MPFLSQEVLGLSITLINLTIFPTQNLAHLFNIIGITCFDRKRGI